MGIVTQGFGGRRRDSNQQLLRPVPHQRLPRALGGADAPHTWTPGGSPLPVSLDSGVTRIRVDRWSRNCSLRPLPCSGPR